jgi:hypothetical protein
MHTSYVQMYNEILNQTQFTVTNLVISEQIQPSWLIYWHKLDNHKT